MIKSIEDRRSIRRYMDKQVEAEKILQILDSARLAPSGSNTQPWQIIVVKEQENREKIANVAYNQKWMVSAPVHLVCVADIKSRLPKSNGLYIDEYSKEFEVKQIIRDKYYNRICCKNNRIIALLIISLNYKFKIYKKFLFTF